jgi:hypothetical protein
MGILVHVVNLIVEKINIWWQTCRIWQKSYGIIIIYDKSHAMDLI